MLTQSFLFVLANKKSENAMLSVLMGVKQHLVRFLLFSGSVLFFNNRLHHESGNATNETNN